MDPQRHADADDQPQREHADAADEPGKRHDWRCFIRCWGCLGRGRRRYNQRFKIARNAQCTACRSVISRARSPVCRNSRAYTCTHNGQGDTLYVGKARVLRDRVRSYLGAHGISPRIDALLDEAQRLEVIVTDSVVEALALENNLIKQRAPKYNILLRDDKTYPVPAAHDRRSLPARPGGAARRARRALLRRSVHARVARAADDVADAQAVRYAILQRGDYRRSSAALPRVRHQAMRGAVRPRALLGRRIPRGGRTHPAVSRGAQRRTAGDAAGADDRGGAAGTASNRRRSFATPSASIETLQDAAAEDGQPGAGRSRRVRAESRARPAPSSRCSRCAAGGRRAHRARHRRGVCGWPRRDRRHSRGEPGVREHSSSRGTCVRAGQRVRRPERVRRAAGGDAAVLRRAHRRARSAHPDAAARMPTRDVIEGWLSGEAGRRVRLVVPKRGEKRGPARPRGTQCRSRLSGAIQRERRGQLRCARNPPRGARSAAPRPGGSSVSTSRPSRGAKPSRRWSCAKTGG